MKMVFSARGVIGDENETHYTQLLHLPGFEMLIEVVGDTAPKVGVQFLGEVKKIVQRTTFTSSTQLKTALRKCRKQDQRVHFAAVYMMGSKLFVVAENKAEVWIRRGNKSGKVLTGGNAGTGAVNLGDVVLLITNSFFSRTNDQLIKESLQRTDPTDIVQSLIEVSEKNNPEKKGGARVLEVNTHHSLSNPAIMQIKDTTASAFQALVHHFSQRRTFLISALCVTIVVVGFMIFISKNAKENETFVTLRAELAEGVALVDLDPHKAREVFERVKTQTIALDTTIMGKKDLQVRDEIIQKTDEMMLLALRKFEVKLIPFFEMSIIKQGAVIDDVLLYQDMLFLLDKKTPAIYRLNTESKASKLLAGGEQLRDIVDFAVSGEEVYVLSKQGMNRVSVEGKLTQVIPADPEWGAIVDAATFGGNLYFLDTLHHIVWKYLSGETSFEPRQNYLLSDSKPDFSDGKRLMIDGAVWVLKGNQVAKFIQGEEVVWQITGMDEKNTTIDDIYTDEHTSKFYVLDNTNHRLVVLDKDGAYQAQYVWQEDIGITRMVVSEVLRKAFLFTSATIYAIELK